MEGLQFRRCIVISERVVKEDLFTSVHISEYELEVRDTKLGEEELTLIFLMFLKKQQKIWMKMVSFVSGAR
jgi:DNA-directed RNA polymerase beta subunit